MSYTFLLDVGVESSAESFSDIPASVLLKSKHNEGARCCSVSATECYHDSRFGTMCEPSMEHPGAERSIASAEDSHAKTSQAQTQTQLELQDLKADCGKNTNESSKKSTRRSFSSKTAPCCDCADWKLFWKTLPKSGMMRRGIFSLLPSTEPTISAKGCSYLPTPTGHNSKEGAYPAEFTRNTPTLAAQIGGKINPDWNEWRMEWPIGWSALKPLEMDKFQSWLHAHFLHS